MQRPTIRSSQNLILGLSLVGILCSCSGTSSGSDDAYYPEPSGNSSYTEPEVSSYVEEEIAIEETEPVAIPYEDGELAFTQEELEFIEAFQRSQGQSYQPGQSFTDAIGQGNQDLHEEQIRFAREQIAIQKNGMAHDSIIDNYSTVCPSTGPCD